ncbi:MAG: hypothetical protein IJ038_03005 [Clostridia bacterium]|nr:hypothetical protein [Clostridia bacterium]
MDNCKDAVRSSIIPLLLGDSLSTHRLSAKIYLKTGIVSYVCDENKTLADHISPFSKFFPLFSKNDDEILRGTLDYIASNKEYLPIIIPCSERYTDFVNANLAFLEPRFIISTPEAFFQNNVIRYLVCAKG